MNDLRKMSDASYNKARNIFSRKLSTRLYPVFKLLLWPLRFSYDFFILDLRVKSPEIYTQREQNYKDYVDLQIEANVRKFHHSGVADDWVPRLSLITEEIKCQLPKEVRAIRGACMGARNGAEVTAFEDLLKKEFREVRIIGTDISPTAAAVPNMIVHDFHNPFPEDVGKVDFIYSNSLDQAANPKGALASWLLSLNEGGAIFLEMNRLHGRRSFSLLDPFSCEVELFPYVFLSFGLAGYIEKVLHVDPQNLTEGVFVIKKQQSLPQASNYPGEVP